MLLFLGGSIVFYKFYIKNYDKHFTFMNVCQKIKNVTFWKSNYAHGGKDF